MQPRQHPTRRQTLLGAALLGGTALTATGASPAGARR
jgi:hypothetical protein